MDKSMKHPGGAKEKEIDDRKKSAGGDAPTAGKSDRPAQEIADDEVEIGKTGGKPGEGSRPITGNSRK